MNIYFAIGEGVLKIIFIFLILLFATRKYILLRRDFSFVFDSMIRKYFEYLSLLIILLFVTISLGVYDGLVIGVIMSFIGLCDYLGLVNPFHLPSVFAYRFKRRLLLVLKLIEESKFSWKLVFSSNHLKLQRKNFYVLSSLFFLLIVIIGISFYFIKFDHYLFSSTWFDTLEKIKVKDECRWFTQEVVPEGVYALINFISHLTNSSLEITIYVYSILQLILVTIIVFWFMQKITKSQVIIPVFVTVFYILGFTYLPSDITNFYQSSSMHLSMTLLLPMMVYMTKMKLLPYGKREKQLKFFLAFLAIALIDLYVYLFVLPIIVVFLGVIYFKTNKLFQILSAYLISVFFSFSLYLFFLIRYDESLLDLLRRTVIAVELYFYNPFMKFNVDRLIFYYELVFVVGFFLNILSAILLKSKWKKRALVFLFVSFIYALTQIKYIWLDIDLLLKMLSIFIPILIGVNISILFDFLNLIVQPKYYTYRGGLVLVITVVIFALFQKNVLFIPRSKTEILHQDLLAVNELILRNYLDRSYAVVNKDEFLNLSSGRRYFLSYNEFLSKKYLKKDALYANNIMNNKYLIKHPDIILPSSVFVFYYDDTIDKSTFKSIQYRMNYLKNEGRQIKTIFKTKQLTVYEIINKPFSSEISQMVF